MKQLFDRDRILRAGVAVGWAFLAQTGLAAANPPMANTSFEIVGPGGSPTSNATAVPGGAGLSAADSWGVFHNTAPSTTFTELVASTLPLGGPRMIHVRTEHDRNGISQVNGPPDSGPENGIASAWVFVNSGKVGLGSGNHGNTGLDVLTSTTGAWEYLQAPNGQSPTNTLILYAVGGAADFFVDEVGLLEIQEWGGASHVEYSNASDEEAVAGGGDHAGPDAGQTLYTRVVDTPVDTRPSDGVDFFPGIGGQEPDAQVDALANGADLGFADVLVNDIDLMVSIAGDPGPTGPTMAAHVERVDGSTGPAMTHRDLHALDLPGDIEDVDGLELWGAGSDADGRGPDASFFSLERDMGDVSVWFDSAAGATPYIARGWILAQVNALGFGGSIEEVDLDALMVTDTNDQGVWDVGDEILFSVRAANQFDGGEIMHWRFGQSAEFLKHGGHVWDTDFDVATAFRAEIDEVDAIEVPEPAAAALIAAGGLALAALGARRRVAADA